jgi:hypothetical protein
VVILVEGARKEAPILEAAVLTEETRTEAPVLEVAIPAAEAQTGVLLHVVILVEEARLEEVMLRGVILEAVILAEEAQREVPAFKVVIPMEEVQTGALLRVVILAEEVPLEVVFLEGITIFDEEVVGGSRSDGCRGVPKHPSVDRAVILTNRV